MPSAQEILAAADPVRAARVAGLRYVNDQEPGLRRVQAGKGFRYVGVNGRPIRDAATIERINSLVIPPAWTSVWICSNPDGHIQATGVDDRGRKQYLYHEQWREVRDQTKFGRMLRFARVLPRIRRRVKHDLKLPGLPREKVLAAIVRLLDRTAIRVGNDEYTRENKTFGLTTLRNRHARVRGETLHLEFTGKSGVHLAVDVEDRRLARIVRRCQDLPGQDLFEYLDEAGAVRGVSSGDVNDYIKEISGEDFTAKDFRTWAGTLYAARELCACGPCGSESAMKKNIVAAVKATAGVLGNRPATCRKYYVHPAVIDAYQAGRLRDALACPCELATSSRGANRRLFEKAVARLLKTESRRAPNT